MRGELFCGDEVGGIHVGEGVLEMWSERGAHSYGEGVGEGILET